MMAGYTVVRKIRATFSYFNLVECLRLKLQCCYPPISHDNTTTSTGNIGAVWSMHSV